MIQICTRCEIRCLPLLKPPLLTPPLLKHMRDTILIIAIGKCNRKMFGKCVASERNNTKYYYAPNATHDQPIILRFFFVFKLFVFFLFFSYLFCQ